MADSIRESIFQDIKTAIQGISKSAGYKNNIDSDNVHIIHGAADDSAYGYPLVFIYPGPEYLNDEKCEKGKDYYELGVQVEAFLRSNKETMNTSINTMLADLKKALGADHTRGGLAIDTRFVANDAYLVDLTGETCGIIMLVQVDYEHNYADPYNQ